MEEAATFVFANCAGAARKETCDPRQLGTVIKAHLLDKGLQRVRALGLSEVILSSDAGPVVSAHLDDLTAFQIGFDHDVHHRYYFPHLNSRDHSHQDAVKTKWGGATAPKRITTEFHLKRVVYQGTGALVFGQCEPAQGIMLRPAGINPDVPGDYLGDRDSEPRTALLLPQFQLADDLQGDLCFCQLETHKTDRRVGKNPPDGPGVVHRHQQLKRLSACVSAERPTIILGDFNSRPGSDELNRFCESYGFLQVLPHPSMLPRADYSLKLHTFGNDDVYAPDLEKEEKEQHWPYSHLEHGILIDHAFVRGLDTRRWHCELTIPRLPNESDDDRVSDHRPIILTIYRRSQGHDARKTG